MQKINLAYIWSFRNAAADKAGQHIPYKGSTRYMKSPLEYLVEVLANTELGDKYQLVGIINDDDPENPRDVEKIKDYGFSYHLGKAWFYPPELHLNHQPLNGLLHSVPSSYRQHPRAAAEHISGKKRFEHDLLNTLQSLNAELVILDGLLVILDEIVRPGSFYYRKIVNIHPGITRLESPYEHRGAYATLDALYGVQGKKITNWNTMESIPIKPLDRTGASFHYVDNGVDSGEVITDVLDTLIKPDDNILELRWNNFQHSLFPALSQGLAILAGKQL